jgi:hypothetical protein
MSNTDNPNYNLPSPTTSDKSVEADLHPEDHSLLYLSLEAALKHPNCISNDWIDSIGDFKTNPRIFRSPPYNDGASHYVDHKQKPLNMAFPAVLQLNGKYGKIGPYFNLMGDQGVKVLFFFFFFLKKKTKTQTPIETNYH